MLKNIKRCSAKARKCYSNQVQKYLQNNGFVIVQKIYEGALSTHELRPEEVQNVLGDEYPVAPWVNDTDVVGQFICILEEAGYTFSYNEEGRVCFKDDELYGAIVKNHLRFSGRYILDSLSDYCEQNGSRLTYYQAQRVLGFHYPRAPYVNKEDTRACTILFLKETGLPFKFDDTYVYFP
ncbi:MAG: hypothetical protein IJ272_03345 [Clostridia bacterium]|nr:hypothetical protein [Clostridia bacterium]